MEQKSNSINIDLNDTHWERQNGHVSEFKVDSRWVLRENGTEEMLGHLRIVSHPDLKPGYMRSFFTYIISIENKSRIQQLQAIEDYQMTLVELEAYSVDKEYVTEKLEYDAPFKELETSYGVKVFGK